MTRPKLADWLLIPSVYGLLGWCLALVLYELRVLPWEPTSLELYLVCAVQIFAFALSARIHISQAVKLRVDSAKHRYRGSAALLLALHALGFIGIAVYVRDFAVEFGGIAEFVATFFSEALAIRALAAEQSSIGVQVSYFGWIAITATPFAINAGGPWVRRVLVLAASVQFLGNLLFIDRTRPIWLLFMLAMSILLINANRLSNRTSMRALIAAPVVVTAVFVGVGIFIGKLGAGDADASILDNVYHNLTAGFAYLNHVLVTEGLFDFSTARTLAPLHNVLAVFGFGEPPPSTILDTYELPFRTNVGTALEPFYRDGGWSYMLVGMLCISFLVDQLALRSASYRNPFSMHLWSALCFVSATSFFAQKLGNLSVWLFILLALTAVAIQLCLNRRRLWLSIPSNGSVSSLDQLNVQTSSGGPPASA